jgi:hypothetical protein
VDVRVEAALGDRLGEVAAAVEHAPDALRLGGHTLGERAQHALLVVRVVQDAPLLTERVEQGARELLTRVLATAREVLVVLDLPVRAQDVQRPLHGDHLERTRPHVQRQRRVHGLEVEEHDRLGQIGRPLACSVQDEEPRLDRGAPRVSLILARHGLGGRLVDLAHVDQTGRLERGAQLGVAAAPGQLADGMLGGVGGAAAQERAVVRARAAHVGRELRGLVGGEHREHVVDPGRDLRQDLEDLAGHVGEREQSGRIVRAAVPHVVLVDVHQLRRAHLEPGAPHHVHLHRHVHQVLLRLVRARRLDLDDLEGTVIQTPQDVDPHLRALVGERRLVEHVRALVERRAGRGDRGGVVQVVLRDEHATREPPLGERADPVSHREPGSRGLGDRIGFEVGAHGPPQLQRALQPLHEPRLRQRRLRESPQPHERSPSPVDVVTDRHPSRSGPSPREAYRVGLTTVIIGQVCMTNDIPSRMHMKLAAHAGRV